MDNESEDFPFLNELLARERHGVLCTAHARHGGWPFGSLAPFALSTRREPVFLFSAIAEHTHNLVADPRASLLVQDHRSLDQPLEGARVTLMGSAEALEGRSRRDGLDCYLGRFPEAEAWATAHDFSPFLLRVERVRWIRGFGSMGWIERPHW
jgi:putative heme iron utilization protein